MPTSEGAALVETGEFTAPGNVLCQLFPIDLLFGKTAYGACVAHLQLLQALACHGCSERELRLVVDLPYRPGPPPLPPTAVSEIDHLRECGMTVSVQDLLELPVLLTSSQTVMISSGQESVRVLASREMLPGASAPVCTLCHSLVWPDFISSYSTAARLNRACDCIVVPSYAGVQAIHACFDIQRSSYPNLWEENHAPRVECIPYGVFPKRFGTLAQEQCRNLLGVPQNAVVLACVGRLTDRLKADFDPLLMVTWRLAKQGLNPYLLIAGADDQPGYRAELEAKAGMLGIGSRFSCRTDFDESLKPLIYTASDVCVFPVDNLQETFGLAVLEAMASARPVVATNWSGYRDLVVPGETGFLVDCSMDSAHNSAFAFLLAISRIVTAEAYMAKHTLVDVDGMYTVILRLIENPDLRRQFGEAGRRRVIEKFSWSESVRRFENLWMEQREAAKGVVTTSATGLGEHIDRYLAAYAGSDKKLKALLCDQNTSNLISEYGVTVLGMLPAYLRAKARRCLEMLVREGRLSLNGLDPDLRQAAWLLAKKGIAAYVYEPEEEPGKPRLEAGSGSDATEYCGRGRGRIASGS
jgi:glycosyltransferase involved in cell wall biosynthesis